MDHTDNNKDQLPKHEPKKPKKKYKTKQIFYPAKARVYNTYVHNAIDKKNIDITVQAFKDTYKEIQRLEKEGLASHQELQKIFRFQFNYVAEKTGTFSAFEMKKYVRPDQEILKHRIPKPQKIKGTMFTFYQKDKIEKEMELKQFEVMHQTLIPPINGFALFGNQSSRNNLTKFRNNNPHAPEILRRHPLNKKVIPILQDTLRFWYRNNLIVYPQDLPVALTHKYIEIAEDNKWISGYEEVPPDVRRQLHGKSSTTIKSVLDQYKRTKTLYIPDGLSRRYQVIFHHQMEKYLKQSTTVFGILQNIRDGVEEQFGVVGIIKYQEFLDTDYFKKHKKILVKKIEEFKQQYNNLEPVDCLEYFLEEFDKKTGFKHHMKWRRTKKTITEVDALYNELDEDKQEKFFTELHHSLRFKFLYIPRAYQIETSEKKLQIENELLQIIRDVIWLYYVQFIFMDEFNALKNVRAKHIDPERSLLLGDGTNPHIRQRALPKEFPKDNITVFHTHNLFGKMVPLIRLTKRTAGNAHNETSILQRVKTEIDLKEKNLPKKSDNQNHKVNDDAESAEYHQWWRFSPLKHFEIMVQESSTSETYIAWLSLLRYQTITNFPTCITVDRASQHASNKTELYQNHHQLRTDSSIEQDDFNMAEQMSAAIGNSELWNFIYVPAQYTALLGIHDLNGLSNYRANHGKLYGTKRIIMSINDQRYTRIDLDREINSRDPLEIELARKMNQYEKKDLLDGIVLLYIILNSLHYLPDRYYTKGVHKLYNICLPWPLKPREVTKYVAACFMWFPTPDEDEMKNRKKNYLDKLFDFFEKKRDGFPCVYCGEKIMIGHIIHPTNSIEWTNHLETCTVFNPEIIPPERRIAEINFEFPMSEMEKFRKKYRKIDDQLKQPMIINSKNAQGNVESAQHQFFKDDKDGKTRYKPNKKVSSSAAKKEKVNSQDNIYCPLLGTALCDHQQKYTTRTRRIPKNTKYIFELLEHIKRKHCDQQGRPSNHQKMKEFLEQHYARADNRNNKIYKCLGVKTVEKEPAPRKRKRSRGTTTEGRTKKRPKKNSQRKKRRKKLIQEKNMDQ